jgi:hypothetical protein
MRLLVQTTLRGLCRTIADSPTNATTSAAEAASIVSDDIWAVAAFAQDLYHFDGTSWSAAGNPIIPGGGVVNRAQGVAVVGACDVWSVGALNDGINNATLTERLQVDTALPGDINDDGSVKRPT